MLASATPPKYPRTPYLPFSPTIASDSRRLADPSRFVGERVVVTEKLDGSCTVLHRGAAYARSVSAPSTAKWMAMVKKHHAWKITEPDVFPLWRGTSTASTASSTSRCRKTRRSTPSPSGTTTIASRPSALLPTTRDSTRFRWCRCSSMASSSRRTRFAVSLTRLRREPLGPGRREGGSGPSEWRARFPHPSSAAPFARAFAQVTFRADQHWTRNWRACRIARAE